MSGTDPDPKKEQPDDRTMAYRPEQAAASPPPDANLPRIPGITLHFELARGGMGVVYSGRQDFLDRRVAVKLLSVELGGESFVQRFQREAKILAGIKHPNIVACHMAGQTDAGQSYLVMEFIDGPSLKKWITDHGVVPIKAALRTTRGVAQALGHAHTLGIIHRDVKPENILLETVTSTALDVSFPFTPKVVDLGLARSTGGSASLGLTSPGSVMGTPATMSPEQYDEPDAVDFRTDIYGLGCVLYEMLVGQPAFRGKRLSDIVAKKREPVAPDPCRENPEVPPAVGALVQSMLATDREDRPHSYKDLDEQLVALMDTMSSSSSRVTKLPKVVGEDTEVTTFRRPGTRADEPGSPGKSKPPAKDQPPAKSGGPGVLRTAEINFLAEGLDVPGGGGPASPFQTRPPSPSGQQNLGAGGTVAGGPEAGAFQTRSLPAGTGVSPAPGPVRNMAGVYIAIALAVIALAGGAWAVFKPGPTEDPKTDPPKGTNRPPVVAPIKGPDKADLRKEFKLEVEATDPDKDKLFYDWKFPEEILTVRGSRSGPTINLKFTEGLPGLKAEISVDVRDGTNTESRTHEVTINDYPGVPALLGFDNPGSGWTIDRSSDRRWTEIMEIDDRHVSCRAISELRTLRTSLGDEPYWEWEGSLVSMEGEKGGYAKVGLRFEFGNTGWTVLSQRSKAGKDKERGFIEVLQSTRAGDRWTSDPVKPACRVDWEQPQDDDFRGLFSVQRRGKQLILQIGKSETPIEGAEKREVGPSRTFDLPDNASDGQLTLFVDQGIGHFRIKKR